MLRSFMEIDVDKAVAECLGYEYVWFETPGSDFLPLATAFYVVGISWWCLWIHLRPAPHWCRARSRIIKCDLYGILWSLCHCEGWLDRTNHWPGFKRINWGCVTLFSSTHGGFAWLLLSTIVAQVWWWLGVNKKARHLWLISKCVFANIGDYSPGNQSQLSQMAIQDSIWF